MVDTETKNRQNRNASEDVLTELFLGTGLSMVRRYLINISNSFECTVLTQEIADAGLAVQQYHLKDYCEEEFLKPSRLST
ncbi:MAG: hypothetical protein JWP67_1408 [Mucilaginibacter sp.]|nr:hypothetical protein [Mucilaginibacter sp.]